MSVPPHRYLIPSKSPVGCVYPMRAAKGNSNTEASSPRVTNLVPVSRWR